MLSSYTRAYHPILYLNGHIHQRFEFLIINFLFYILPLTLNHQIHRFLLILKQNYHFSYFRTKYCHWLVSHWSHYFINKLKCWWECRLKLFFSLRTDEKKKQLKTVVVGLLVSTFQLLCVVLGFVLSEKEANIFHLPPTVSDSRIQNLNKSVNCIVDEVSLRLSSRHFLCHIWQHRFSEMFLCNIRDFLRLIEV